MLCKSLAIMVAAVVVPSLCPPAVASPPDPSADPALTTLPSIVVTATESPVQRLIDRRVYSVSTDLQSVSGTAADVLNQVPSVEVDADGNVSLRGNSKVTILVDGKPSAQLSGASAGDGLLQFSASDIDKIEVMNNPPAQFRAEGSAGVINIITKKTHKAGPSGTLRASLGNKHRYVLGGTGNYNVGRLNLSGSIGLRHDTRERIIESTLVAADPITNHVVVSREVVNERLHRQIPSIKAGIDYRLNDHQSLGLSLNHRERSGNRFFDQHDASVLENGSPVAGSDRHSDGHEWSLNSEQTVRFSQILRQPEETVDLSLHRTLARERENYAYRNTYTLPVGGPRFDHLNLSLDLVTTEFSADYALALSRQRSLKLGYDFQEDRNAFSNSGDTVDPVTGLPVVNPVITNDFRYLQRVHAAYVTYQTSAGSWNLQGGARLERSAIDTLQITGGIMSAQRYARVYPTLHLERLLSEESTLSLSLSRRVSRPDAQALNPFIDRQATHNLRRGNPNLLPQDTRSFEIGYSVASNILHYDLTGYLRRNRNSVTDVTQLLSTNVVLTTKANLPNSTSGGLEFTANGRVMPKLSYGLSGNLFYNQIDAVALGATGLKSTTGLNVKASLDYRPTPIDTAQISFSRSDRSLTAQGYVSAINLVNVGYERKITADLSAIFTISDLFSGQKTQRFVRTPVLSDTYQRTQIGRIFYVGVVYLLGPSRKGKATGFDYDE
jgi:outer membrane receptor for ferrienterochelin and colicin